MSSSANTGAGQDRFVSRNPGRDVQRVGTARFLGQDPLKIHQPVWAVTGNLGDSQCYLGVTGKVEAIQAALAARIRREDLPIRLIPPAYTLGVSDGQLNGTDRMRYSLIGRELANDSIDAHLNANEVKGLIAVVACDKPPVGTLAAVLEHDEPAVFLSDGSIKPESIRRAASASIWSRRFRWRATAIPRGARAWRSTPDPDRAAAAACSPTTPCSRSSPCSAWSRCTWSHRRPTIRGVSASFPSSSSTASWH
jgi:hypothetical protein